VCAHPQLPEGQTSAAMAYRDRAESWDDPKAPISTEADLSSKFDEARKLITR
jgi:hypothetical protein